MRAETGNQSSNNNLMEHINSHVLLVPFPFQGHVAPFMKLAHKLASRGCKVTFFITESLHERIEKAASNNSGDKDEEFFRIVSVPDGLPLADDRKDATRLTDSIFNVMPGYLEEFIKIANKQENDNKVTCVIADCVFGWALEIAEKMGLKKAIFFTAAPGAMAMVLHIPKLIEAGILDANDGTMIKNAKIQLSPSLPTFNDADFIWNFPENESMKKSAFHYMLLIERNLKISNWVICNWFHDLDPSADNLLENLVPVGPLHANGQPIGNFWLEDLSCLSWLDRQARGSVIYVAFGSTGKLNQNQFDDLALGLELVGRPFLWVVSSGLTDGVDTEYPEGFKERVANRGKIVQWAPQEKVLAHPSIACYLTQCGWNSIMEGIYMGVPMLCRPYFTDQFYNRTCVCYGWKIGLELNCDENGIVTRHEIKKKIELLLSDNGIKENVFKLKELAQKSITKGGSSLKNLENFVAQLKPRG